jgi:hypothetical protein
MAIIMNPTLKPEQAEELICRDCGTLFVSHGVGDGLEQLCNDCFASKFTSEPATKAASLGIAEIYLS